MTDDTDRPEEDTPEAKAAGPLGGERLAEARSLMGEIFVGTPTFTDLEVVDEWTDETA